MKFIRTAAISFVFVAIVGTQAAPAGAQVLDSAAASLANGQAWHATQLLRPVLADSATRTPRAVLLAARAAAAWRGWATVRTLLNGQPWIDSIGDEIGHRLLAEAALIGSHNDEALVEARRAARAPNRGAHRTPFEQAHREVLLAQAFEANDLLDSAAIHYRRAMERVPELADWLALRAAAVTTDSAQRARLYDGVALPAALERIPWTEAQARERTGDLTGAASQYRQLGAVVRAISLAWRDATSDPGRRALAGDLARIIDDPRTSITAVRAALDVVDDVIPPFTTAQWLLVARRAGKVGRSQDAVDAFATISRHTRLSARDRIAYGTALGALQRWDEAAAEFKGISAKSVAGIAAYFRARALLRSGRTAASITALHRIVRQFPHDAKAAGTALFLLADLALDSGHPDSARAFYRQLGARYPTSTYRAHAILLAAVIAFALDHPEVTARELSVAIAHHRTVAEHDAARYWLARAQSRLGDTSKAKTIWRELVADGPDNYYAVRAAARLDTMPWSAPAASAPPP